MWRRIILERTLSCKELREAVSQFCPNADVRILREESGLDEFIRFEVLVIHKGKTVVISCFRDVYSESLPEILSFVSDPSEGFLHSLYSMSLGRKLFRKFSERYGRY